MDVIWLVEPFSLVEVSEVSEVLPLSILRAIDLTPCRGISRAYYTFSLYTDLHYILGKSVSAAWFFLFTAAWYKMCCVYKYSDVLKLNFDTAFWLCIFIRITWRPIIFLHFYNRQYRNIQAVQKYVSLGSENLHPKCKPPSVNRKTDIYCTNMEVHSSYQ